jgi:hypothetical protein
MLNRFSLLTGILQKSFWSVLTLDDVNQLTQYQRNIRFRISSKLDADFSYSPCCVVAHRNELWIQVVSENWQKVRDVRMDMLKTSFGEISKKSER